MFVAGDIDGNPEQLESLVTVMEAARVGLCRNRPEADRPIRLGPIELRGPTVKQPEPGPEGG